MWALDLPAADRDAIAAGNARRLLRLSCVLDSLAPHLSQEVRFTAGDQGEVLS